MNILKKISLYSLMLFVVIQINSREIDVKTMGGDIITIDVSLGDTIESIKEKIAKATFKDSFGQGNYTVDVQSQKLVYLSEDGENKKAIPLFTKSEQTTLESIIKEFKKGDSIALLLYKKASPSSK